MIEYDENGWPIRPILSPLGQKICDDTREWVTSGRYWDELQRGLIKEEPLPVLPPSPVLTGIYTPIGVIPTVVDLDAHRKRRWGKR